MCDRHELLRHVMERVNISFREGLMTCIFSRDAFLCLNSSMALEVVLLLLIDFD